MNPLRNWFNRGAEQRGILLLLFLVLSILLHLAAWSGFSGVGYSLLEGLNRAAHEEVVSFLIADNAPSQPTKGNSPPSVDWLEPRTHAASAVPPTGIAEATATASDDVVAEDELAKLSTEKQNTGVKQETASEVPRENSNIEAPPQTTHSASAGQGDSPVADDGRKTAAADKTPVPNILPFTRERLTFSLYWSGIHVGTAILDAVKNGENSTISSEVHSNAVISTFYKVEDRAEARLVRGRASRFKLVQNEGKHHRNKETIFDIERNKVIYVNHLSHSQEEFDMNGKLLWDIITGFYYLRRQQLETGASVYVYMFDSSKFLNAEVKVVGRDTAELEGGREVSTIVVEPIIKTEGLFQKSGSIQVWLTDDERRIPVRMETAVKFGRIIAKLTSFSIVN